MYGYLITNIKNSEPILQGAIHITHKMINGRNNGWKRMTRATVTLFSLTVCQTWTWTILKKNLTGKFWNI
jgi:hypothetical protein